MESLSSFRQFFFLWGRRPRHFIGGVETFQRDLIPDDLPEGPVVIPLESGIFRKCRADLSDLRVVSSTEAEIGLRVQGIEQP